MCNIRQAIEIIDRRTEVECHLSMDLQDEYKRTLYINCLPITEVETIHPQIAKFINKYKHIEKYSKMTPNINQDKR